jgi:glycerol-3-phosphate acyltransferase PlsY
METALLILAIGLCTVTGYILGSLNFAVLVAKSQGFDILKEGSGNPGATNVKRVVGKRAGNLVFALDVMKGAVGTFLPFFVFWGISSNWGEVSKIPFDLNSAATLYQLIAGFTGTILGHCFSIFLNFKGGKGVASTIGGLLVILPLPILIGALIWVILFFTTRYVSVASIGLSTSLPLTCIILHLIESSPSDLTKIVFASIIALFNLWTHRSNLSRLRQGTELRFGEGKKKYHS